MIFGTPVTWLLAEFLAIVLFVICMIHDSRQEHGTIKVLELIGFLFYSAIFENIGVYTQIYDYNLHRIMLIGKVPLEILMIEAVIFYAGLRLVDYLHIPNWGKPFVVGFLASLQDMTLDPSGVFDLHSLDGVMSGQWNWASHYDGTFFGIPYFNFSGWMYLMVYYVIAIQVGMWLYKKYKKEIIGYLYPFVGGLVGVILLVSPITQFLLFGSPFFPFYTKGAEIALLVFNYSLGLFILLRYSRIDRPFSFKRDGLVFFIPMALHLYDIVIAFALKIEIAYIPVLLVSAIHIAYFFYVYIKGKRLGNVSIRQSQVQSEI